MPTFPYGLAKHPFFQDLAPRHLEPLVGMAAGVRYEPGQFLFREGSDAEHFYLLFEGQVAVETSVPGQGHVTIQTVGAGEVLGWSWVVPPHRWRFDARAGEPTLAIALPARALRERCEQDHEFGYEMLKRLTGTIARRLEATRLQLLDVYGVHA